LKRILGIVASPRVLGNCEILTRVIMEETGPNNILEMIRLTDLDIKSCRACYSCLHKESPCVINDDLSFLLERIRNSDAVVIAAPCYILGPHSSIKKVQDRFVSIGNKYEQYAGKPCVTVTAYGAPGWLGYTEPALNLTARFLNLNLIDSAVFFGAHPAEVIEKPSDLQRARQLGSALFDPSYKRAARENECPVCWSDILQYDGEEITCPFCGTRGAIKADGEKTRLVFYPKDDHRFTDQGRKRHFDTYLNSKKQEFLNKRQRCKELQNPYRSASYWVTPDIKK
jgi:multimeric flavodoxin WrbA